MAGTTGPVHPGCWSATIHQMEVWRMNEVLRYEAGSGTVLVEVDSFGVPHPARNVEGILDSGRHPEDIFAIVRMAADAAIETMKGFSAALLEVPFDAKLAGRRLSHRAGRLERPLHRADVLASRRSPNCRPRGRNGRSRSDSMPQNVRRRAWHRLLIGD